MAFNEEEIKKLSKKSFIAMHQHHAKDYDLAAEYDKIVPPKKEKPKRGKK